MKISLNWLKDFVDVNVPIKEVARALVSAGLEIASIEHHKVPDGIIVGMVKTVAEHPKADKLHVCTVSTGTQDLQIVCGAPNVHEGMRAPLAMIGTVFGDMTIKEAKLRGVESFGMLCSERELGISEDHAGLMELPDECEIGKPLSAYFPEDDVIEIEITPNRGDCLSVLGVAREIACIFGQPLKHSVPNVVEKGAAIGNDISVTIEDPDRCPRYTGRLVRNVKVAPSPIWMKNRLAAAGLRSINNLVDVTNYCMIAFGQPMHAFDYDRIRGKKIIVKTNDADASYTTLDNAERKLKSGDLLICDAQGPVALAGIMGGSGSEIADTTTSVFLECAYFNPVGVRMTSKRLGLSTDSSYRFERGVDPHGALEDALHTAAALLIDIAGGEVAAGTIDVYPQKMQPKHVAVRTSRVNRILGTSLDAGQVKKYLAGLGFTCVSQSDSDFVFDIPQYRSDITSEADLIEEVGRLFGYDNIPTSEYGRVNLVHSAAPAEKTMDTVRKAVAYLGFNEIVTNTMTADKLRHLVTPHIVPVPIVNPLSPDMAQMRTNLLGSHLQALSHNLNRKNQNNRLFELGKVFRQDLSSDTTAVERTQLALLIQGSFVPAGWNTAAVPVSFPLLKGVLDSAVANMGAGRLTYAAGTSEFPYFENDAAAVDGEHGIRGAIGKVAKRLLDHFDIKSPVYFAVLDMSDFVDIQLPTPRYAQLPRFPSLDRDFCFVMPSDFLSSTITDTITGISDLVEEVVPFDVYAGDKLGCGLKSIAYSVRFRSREKTLAEKEAEELSAKIVGMMKDKFNIVLRS